MENDTVEVVENVEVIEPNGNVISFTKSKDVPPIEDFNFQAFLDKSGEFKDDIEDFVFIGVRKDGNTTVSAKAENNMHLYWLVKRFLTHLESNLFG